MTGAARMIQMLPLCVLLVLQFLSDRLTTAEPATNTTVLDVTAVEYNFFDHNYHLMDKNNLTISGNKSLIVFVHGFRSSPRTGVVADLGKSLVQYTDSNVVLVDWSKWTQKLDYVDVVFRLPTVATYLVDWLYSLRDRGIVQSFDDVTLIGHSLGAQLIGYTGHRLNGTIKRVIALDPAQPNFKDSQKNERVDVNSAQFVMVLHTSTMFLGLREPVGHVDFYFNGGQIQPSCNSDTVCGHVVVLNYLADSLKNSNEFKAYRCQTLSDCEKKIVDNKEPTINMDIYMPNSTRGLYSIIPCKKNFRMYSRLTI
ncbi:lipase member H isoform X3 [Acyrthosiphon pisum]|uniref:Lipase domain-containing protein n=1 Tax=Acyrthosiphon pisum TaxID=7029 RepID=A0A8R2NRA9_ACYPI|nr:lipase member H isoform X3 [Acyrthosiphon pisum]|eukprot:XP_016660224.1 PREDICTED: lipase member H-like isoform X3 [Acyrthosiphon pisum]